MEARLNLVTLGVADLAASTAFYQRLGWRLSSASTPEVSFFDLNGVVLALYPAADLARDAGVPARPPGGFALAQNHADRAGVDAAMERARTAGARMTQPAAPTPWGGYAGTIADLDGHLWEIAHNPFWPLDAQGRIVLPG